MNAVDLGPYIDLAVRLADAAQPVSLKYFRSGVGADDKADESPVTIADRDAEEAMRALISAAHPDHGIVGEEHGAENEGADFVWVLDPIDGTQSFVTGKPLFGTLIALLQEGAPVVGVMDMPALGERWVGAKGCPTLFQGEPVSTRPCADLKQAWLYATSPQMFTSTRFPRFEALRKASRRAVYGAECYAYGLLANGHVDIVCEDTLQAYDVAALVPIVEGAGGRLTEWSGRAHGLDGDGTALAVGDPGLHERAIEILTG